MVALTPSLLMVVVQSGFRLGQALWEMHDDAVREADVVLAQYPVVEIDLELAALDLVRRNPTLVASHALVFENGVGPQLKRDVDPIARAAAVHAGMEELMRHAREPLPAWAGESATTVLVVHTLRGPSARTNRWARFGMLLTRTAIQAVAAQPNITGLKGNAEALLGAFALKVETIIGARDIQLGAIDGHSFRERASATLLQAALATVAENPTMVVSTPHWAEFVGAVLSPLAQAQGEEDGARLISLDRLEHLMRGPMAQAALGVLQARQGDFFGARLAADTAAGAVTQEILSAAARVPAGEFDILNTFSQRGLTLIYHSALNAAATRPELFVHSANGATLQSWRELLGGVAGVLRDAPPPFDLSSGLGDQLICTIMDVAANHLSRAALAEFGGDEPWTVVKRNILTSIIQGFGAALHERIGDPANERTNPFLRLFSQTQAVEIVRIIAEQAALTPQMLLGEGHKNEIYGVARAVATFLSDPNAKLASASDWRTIIAVALEEGARNPGALFNIDPDAAPESHLAVSLIGMLLRNAATGLRDNPLATGSARRPGFVLFGDTLRDAITMTMRAAANNATALLNEPAHMSALNLFVGQLQTLVQSRNGALGAAEWLWLYRCFVAEIIETGDPAGIAPDRLEAAVRSLSANPPSAAPATSADSANGETP